MRRILLGGLLIVASCRTAEPVPTPPPQAAAPARPAPPAPLPMTAGLDEAAMDPGADPCDDFYRYACGGWLDKTGIPGDRPAWSRMMEISERNERVLREILEAAAAGSLPPDTAYARKLGDYYATCMDEAKLENGLPELQAELKSLDEVKDGRTLAAMVGELHTRGVQPLFEYASVQDFEDATQVIGQVDQGGLGLPDRDYYVKEDAKTKAVRDAYAQHVQNMFKLLGESDAQAARSAATVMEIETALARASLTRVERREPKSLYHRLERAGLEKSVPEFPWATFFKITGPEGVQSLNVTHVPFFKEVGRLVKVVPAAAWRTYLAWHVVHADVPALPKRFQDEDFQFKSRALTGAKEDLPRWKKCVQFTDQALGEALGRPFVERTFGAEGKATTRELVAEVEAAFERDLDTLPWMDAPTRARALEKVRKIVNQVGYPDTWRNYDKLQLDRGSFLGNLLRANAFETARKLARIGKPVDRSEWEMTPPTVNAYYDPSMNEMVFPAGILQPPMFNRAAPAPVNFGAMGLVMGHETTHGFDDEGRQFDADGNLHGWWTGASDKAFRERAACVEKQYSQEIALEDIHVDGALTLGENVADMGGLKLAYNAMVEHLRKSPPAERSRFTPEQQFFLGYGQALCSKFRPEQARLRAATDPHSPRFLRVIVPLRNFKPFREAFGCKDGSRMVKSDAERCEVW